MSLFFIESRLVEGSRICLTGELAHRLRNVLRCQPGETIFLADENQTRYTATIGKITPESVLAEIVSSQNTPEPSHFSIRLFQAILKGKKMDWVIQKGTELGMNRLIPVITERTVPRPRRERGSHQLDRWRKIAVEAAQQCGRNEPPEIDHPIPLSELFQTPQNPAGNQNKLCLFLWEQEKALKLKSVLGQSKNKKLISILTGPEGGFSEKEFSETKKGGWTPVSLGPRILRAETAGMAVLSAILYDLSDSIPDSIPDSIQ